MPSLEELAQQAEGVDEDEGFGVDYSGAKEYEKIPDGVWDAYVKDVEPDVSKKGNATVKWTFVFVDGQDGLPGTNRQMTRSTPAEGEHAGITKGTVRDLGHDPESEPRIVPKTYRGTPVRLTVGPQKNDPQYQEIKKIDLREES
jgi:hypothetical protein